MMMSTSYELVPPMPIVAYPPQSVASRARSRVFALSDIHADIKQNMTWLRQLSVTDYVQDTLILAGDVSDNLAVLQDAFLHLRATFAHVCFVPGNHELWVRRKECSHSVAKFQQILRLCDALGVHIRPLKIDGADNRSGVWIVPLFSWYVKPEEGPGSLFVAKEGEDPTLSMWSDNYFTAWPRQVDGSTVADYFLRLNEPHVASEYDAPIISFSHFVPRTELIYSTREELRAAGTTFWRDPHPSFNFSRVAGCAGIEAQIRRLGSRVHVYGHQHRNRDRCIDGVRYISHCLGYPREQHRRAYGAATGPALIWEAAAAST